MEGLGVLVFIVIAVLAALNRAKQMGTGTGAPRPGTRLPRPGTPYPGGASPRPGSTLPQDVPMPQAGTRASAEAERAATLVPDDLWAILTGERRSPLPPRPLQTPHELTLPGNGPPAPPTERGSSSFEVVHRPQQAQPTAEKAEGDLVWWPPLETSASETRPSEPVAPVPAPDERAVAPRLTPSVVAAATTALTVPAGGPAARPPRRRRGPFAGPAELRRAFVAQLVLGPPKALE